MSRRTCSPYTPGVYRTVHQPDSPSGSARSVDTYTRMMQSIALPAILLALLFGVRPASGQATPAEDTSPHSAAELLNEHATISPGKSFSIGLRMTMEPTWHSYWENPGDAGEATYIDWTLPEGFSAGPIQWPFPERIDAGPLTSYGYSDDVLLITEISPPADLPADTTITIEASAYWLICADICLPAEEHLSTTLVVTDGAPAPVEGPHASRFAEARSRQPRSSPDWDIQATRNAGSYVLEVRSPPASDAGDNNLLFFPLEYGVIAHAAPQPLTREGGITLLALQQSEYAASPAERLRGVLVRTDGQPLDAAGLWALDVDAVVRGAAPNTAAGAGGTLWWFMLLAGLGGILLNLMPCVFPVLSIKILGMSRQAQEDHTLIRLHGLTFGAGVLLSFWILAGLLLGLRAGGSQIGWGFQLQSPYFIAVMAVLFFSIGLNLMGVFEFGGSLMRLGGRLSPGSRGGGYRESFFSGVLATVVATPCTAPFMGAALGAAVALPTPQALLIFTAIGIGMALPYVLLSMAPRLLRRLPTPGAWMETLKHVLSFPMFATVVWLVWVFGRQTSVDGVALLLFGLLLVGVALWTVGNWPAVQITVRRRAWTRGLAAALWIGAAALTYAGAANSSAQPGSGAATTASAWQPFSPELITQTRADGRPMFIDFTAAWCLTCQVNKRTTLDTETVQAAFREKGVVLFRADWTNQDARITEALDAYGRNGVPVYVLYPGDNAEPILLPEILTEGIVLDALEAIPPASERTVRATAG